MAVRVETTLENVKGALQKALDSAKRMHNTSTKTLFKEIYLKEIDELQRAINTLSEIK